jgi:hypothetical protein
VEAKQDGREISDRETSICRTMARQARSLPYRGARAGAAIKIKIMNRNWGGGGTGVVNP